MAIKLQDNFPFEPSNMLEEMGAKILEGNPSERAAWVTSSADGAYITGVWEAQPYTEEIVDCPGEETCYVVSGELIITPKGGEEVILLAGDSYVIPKGFSGLYSVKKTIVKVFHYNGDV
ncbi:cupin domain-containing protein [Pseudomonas sp. PB3P13]